MVSPANDWKPRFATRSRSAAAGFGAACRASLVPFAKLLTIGRLGGDWTVARLGDRRVFLVCGILAVFGFVVLLTAKQPLLALSGFVFIGLGAANVVPILFRRAGRQTQMPVGSALASVTTAGYSGMLVGPAFIGFLAHAVSLRAAFVALALLLVVHITVIRTIAPNHV